MSGRDEILARIRAALGPDPSAPDVTRKYRQARGFDAASVETFAARVVEYRAAVHRCGPEGVTALIRRLTDGEDVIATAAWAALLDSRIDDPSLSPGELDRFDVAVTGCALAIAETGTIVLDGGAASGRRALTLIPDHHVCVVRHDQVVVGVPEAIDALATAAAQRRPITFVSGPSATSDIELERVEGVHGPRRLDLVLVGSYGVTETTGASSAAGRRRLDTEESGELTSVSKP